ncbi:UDP-N-acetylmuramoyl-tripeptide--D-alanyl-D-alanine ligase [Candidatus Daviesbacteria bacterium]|nr:UDP-N-acetylmuramoyl-tripeptide--D-alanyl-D-alanine ligase [Candidatus Daviesbacteria bacterium]
MLKTLSKILPLLDHLYIFQVLEYKPIFFISWFLKHLFARNLQRKHRLEYTSKIKLLLLFTLGWIYLSWQSIGLFLTFLVLVFISPIFILLGFITYLPLDIYFKRKILNQAKEKLAALPKLKIIAITGSYGKTSTKDMLYTLLWKKFRVVKTPKSYNTPLGLAQTILDYLKPNTEVFIAEIGTYKKGEIKYLTNFLNPKIGVITAVAPQHLERFGSLENIAHAKFELVENLNPKSQAFLNGENQWLQKLASHIASHIGSGNVEFYGQKSRYFASGIKFTKNGTSFTLHTPSGNSQITLPLIGEHHVKNFVAAATVALNLGVSTDEIEKRAAKLLPTPHRLEIKKHNGQTIIDNTYNTNPESARAALKLLQNLPGSPKVVITPGLVELGWEATRENRAFAKEAVRVADYIIIVGEYAKHDLLSSLSTNKFPREKTFKAATLNQAFLILREITKPGSVVLLENDLPDQYF